MTNEITEGVKRYFTALKEVKPLTKEEEHKLLYKYKYNNDLNARTKLINSNLKYTISLASNYRGRGLSYEDLISEANMGLIEAIDKFDINQDVKIISYSKWWIMQKIQNAIESRQKNCEDELPEEDEYRLMSDEDNSPKQCEDKTRFQFIDESEEDKKNLNEYIEVIKNNIANLSERDYNIMVMYYGLNGNKSHTLEEIAKVYSISKERVRQRINKNILYLRSKILAIM